MSEDNPTNPASTLTVSPIGYIRTGMRAKFDAPHQPSDGTGEVNVVELLPGHGFERALLDLEGFDRIWLVWWFHRNANWKPRVLPPRGESKKRGVFSTRAPYRPNPIGITAVPLISVSGLTVTIGNCDLVDGTPILDIKPYLKTVDAFPDASLGWLAEVEELSALPPQYSIECSPLAREQLDWLFERGIDLSTRAFPLLERDPKPHRTRRIFRFGPGRFRMGCGAWRLIFSVQDHTVTIESVTRGYPTRLLFGEGYDRVPDRAQQIEFVERWPGAGVEKD